MRIQAYSYVHPLTPASRIWQRRQLHIINMKAESRFYKNSVDNLIDYKFKMFVLI